MCMFGCDFRAVHDFRRDREIIELAVCARPDHNLIQFFPVTSLIGFTLSTLCGNVHPDRRRHFDIQRYAQRPKESATR
jgi:hypothetical protein